MKQINKNKRGSVLRFISVLMLMVLTLSLTACKSKEPITADSFKEKVEGLGYTTIDVMDQFTEYPQVLKGLLCEADGIHVEFYEIDNKDNATAFFNGNKSRVEAYKGSVSTESTVNISSYSKYTLKTSDTYYIVERVGTTAIYAYSDKSESGKLDDIIKELGY